MITERKPLTLDELSKTLVSVFNRVVHEKTAVVVENEMGERVVLRPIASAESVSHAKTDDDYRAFLSAAGSWKDEDVDSLLTDIYASRSVATRSPVAL